MRREENRTEENINGMASQRREVEGFESRPQFTRESVGILSIPGAALGSTEASGWKGYNVKAGGCAAEVLSAGESSAHG